MQRKFFIPDTSYKKETYKTKGAFFIPPLKGVRGMFLYDLTFGRRMVER